MTGNNQVPSDLYLPLEVFMLSLDYSLVDVATTKVHVTHTEDWAGWPLKSLLTPRFCSSVAFRHPGFQASMLNCKNTGKSNKISNPYVFICLEQCLTNGKCYINFK